MDRKLFLCGWNQKRKDCSLAPSRGVGGKKKESIKDLDGRRNHGRERKGRNGIKVCAVAT